jgi:hypothetical protein
LETRIREEKNAHNIARIKTYSSATNRVLQKKGESKLRFSPKKTAGN